MNIRSRPAYWLGAALLLSGCVAGERHRVTIAREWPAAGIERVEVIGVNGDLHVVADGSDQVRMTAEVKSRGVTPTSEENRGYIDTSIEGGTLRIAQRKRRGRVNFRFGSRNVEIDYSLRVPERLALELTTVNGRIATRGTSGDAHLRSVNGAIDAEVHGRKDFRAQTVNGRIRASFTDDFRGARLKTVNGGVQAILPVWASFRCDLAQVNGDFEASFPLSIHSHPGRRRVSGEVNGGRYPLKITTVNGSVRVQHSPEAPARPEPPPAMPESPESPEIPAQPPAPLQPLS